MTTVAIQSVPSPAVQDATSRANSVSSKSNNEASNVKSEEKNSFKDLYDDAKKVDNKAERKTDKHDAAGKKTLAEDGKSLPPESKTDAAENGKESSLNTPKMKQDEDSGKDLFIAQPFSDLNLNESTAKENGMGIGIAEPLKDKLMFSGIAEQPSDKAEESVLSVLTGLNHSEQLKLNAEGKEQGVKLAVNDKLLNNMPAVVSGSDPRSLAQQLLLEKNGEGLAKKDGLNKMLGLSLDSSTDDSMMSNIDKAFNKVLSVDKLSLDAMLGKLDTLTSTATDTAKPHAAPPLSTALNHSLTSPTKELSGVSQTTITETLGKPEWNQSMGKQISWMASQHIRSAEIKLTPANLGTIEVRVDMHDDKLNISFSSRDAGVRDSVEQAMPKLRDMMDEQGFDLGQTDVSEHPFFEQQGEKFSQQENFSRTVKEQAGRPMVDSEHIEERLLKTVNQSMAAVDYYI